MRHRESILGRTAPSRGGSCTILFAGRKLEDWSDFALNIYIYIYIYITTQQESLSSSCYSEFRAFTLFRQDIYTYGKVKEDSKYEKERKILKDEVQQDGKNANTYPPGTNPGLQQTRLVLYQLSYRDQARSPTRTSDTLTILLLPSCSIWPPQTSALFWPFPLPFGTIANGLPPKPYYICTSTLSCASIIDIYRVSLIFTGSGF